MEETVQEKVEKAKTGRKTLTKTQEQYCQLIVTQGMEPLDAMLTVFPNRASYSIGNQKMLLKKLQDNEKVTKRLEELFTELRENTQLGDLYNFDVGVKLLLGQIEKAQEKLKEGNFSESLHRIILTSVQELNRMYGFNIVDRNGNTGPTVNVTFVDVNKPKEGVVIDAQK